ncbi:MAG TPA: hypothetical protein VNJ11_05005 [Bryobacteraceae bacterium]|nr:hypothetical protein [Bryobacteraceae bacterium]
MRNPEKHKKNLVLTWEEEDSFPTHSRSAHLLGPRVKVTKPVAVKGRSGNPAPPKADVLAMREPAPPARITIKQSQPASWDHLKKLERLPNLRAPYQYKAHR